MTELEPMPLPSLMPSHIMKLHTSFWRSDGVISRLLIHLTQFSGPYLATPGRYTHLFWLVWLSFLPKCLFCFFFFISSVPTYIFMWADVNFSLNKQSKVVIIVNICYISDVQIFLLSGSRNCAMLHVRLCVCSCADGHVFQSARPRWLTAPMEGSKDHLTC